MEGCHVIIFISQNPNPNFLLSFHHHGSRHPSHCLSTINHRVGDHTAAKEAGNHRSARPSSPHLTPSSFSPVKSRTCTVFIIFTAPSTMGMCLERAASRPHTNHNYSSATPHLQPSRPHTNHLLLASAALLPHAAAMETATAKQTGAPPLQICEQQQQPQFRTPPSSSLHSRRRFRQPSQLREPEHHHHEPASARTFSAAHPPARPHRLAMAATFTRQQQRLQPPRALPQPPRRSSSFAPPSLHLAPPRVLLPQPQTNHPAVPLTIIFSVAPPDRAVHHLFCSTAPSPSSRAERHREHTTTAEPPHLHLLASASTATTRTSAATPFPQPPPQIERDERFHLAPPRTCTAEQRHRRRRRSMPPLPSRGREESVKVKP